MKAGQEVYHVAFPNVRAQVYCEHFEYDEWIMVVFDHPVSFGGTFRYACDWTCSRTLLFPSSADAAAAHDPNWNQKKSVAKTMIDAFDGIIQEVKADDTHIKLQPIIRGTECDHEWVTWTGLRGTITDCSKCKKVK